ncbi:MAG: hypothetical protein ABSB74_06885 [Tepidisphaeraceae bacterium]|jgi:hypothetical protein
MAIPRLSIVNGEHVGDLNVAETLIGQLDGPELHIVEVTRLVNVPLESKWDIDRPLLITDRQNVPKVSLYRKPLVHLSSWKIRSKTHIFAL